MWATDNPWIIRGLFIGVLAVVVVPYEFAWRRRSATGSLILGFIYAMVAIISAMYGYGAPGEVGGHNFTWEPPPLGSAIVLGTLSYK